MYGFRLSKIFIKQKLFMKLTIASFYGKKLFMALKIGFNLYTLSKKFIQTSNYILSHQ